ncbi:unnamed protein product, partial [Ectocarpus fasciculatus]
QPQEVHLALTGALGEMKVMWASMDGLQDPFVEYAPAEDDSGTWTRQPATMDTYTVPQNWYPAFTGVIYEANMVDLVPGKKAYKYRVGGLDAGSDVVRRSKEFTFSSAPEPAPDQKTTFATFGDQGTFMLLGFSTSAKLIELQDELGVDAVMYAGDLSYAGLSGDLTPFNNVDQKDEFGHIWDLWAIQNEPIAATRPVMTCPGNHESFYNWTAFTHRYKMPTNGNENFWFSYDYGNVHMVSISTEHCFESGCDQMVWLEKDLQAAVANRDSVPWIYDVDVIFQGHLHAYERIHPVNDKVVSVYPTKFEGESGSVDMYHSEGKGPVYVVQGNTGAMQFERWANPKPDFSAGLILDSNYSDTFGFGVITFANSTHLHYSNIPVTGTIGVDEFWIVKRV